MSTLAHDLAGASHDVSWTFAYNPASQLHTATRTNDAYAFPLGTESRSYAANGLNQYTAVAGTAHAYDANGNLTSDGTRTFAYDIENRLVGAGAVVLRYDPLGRLWQLSGGVETTRRFLYDGDALVSEYNPSNVLVRRYVHGSGVDEPLVWYEGAAVAAANRRQLAADRQGSIVAVANSAGTAIAVNAYDEYGVPQAGNVGRFQYAGQMWIPDLGMYHYKARVYSPTLGRFMQTDPVGYEGGINLYAYVRNDPVNNLDPSGLDCVAAEQEGLAGTCQDSGATPQEGGISYSASSELDQIYLNGYQEFRATGESERSFTDTPEGGLREIGRAGEFGGVAQSERNVSDLGRAGGHAHSDLVEATEPERVGARVIPGLDGLNPGPGDFSAVLTQQRPEYIQHQGRLMVIEVHNGVARARSFGEQNRTERERTRSALRTVQERIDRERRRGR